MFNQTDYTQIGDSISVPKSICCAIKLEDLLP